MSSMVDLVRRLPVSLKGKTILITGGTGSFGKKFTEIVLKEHKPKAIRVFSRGELLQMQMRRKFGNHEALRFFIGDGSRAWLLQPQ